ncbi:MAG: dermonecrotic toxin domain-containing protein [Candidatus Rhabdochlamydia sp.]
MANDSKMDAFIYLDLSIDSNAFLSSDDSIQNEMLAQGDIFSFITERQKARITADLYAYSTPKSIQIGSVLNYQSTESAFSTTIASAIAYIPYLLPNIHTTSSQLGELFPNPYTTASEFMKKAIKDKLGLDIDPDKTFIQESFYETKIILVHPSLPARFKKKMKRSSQSLTEAALSNYQEAYSFFNDIKTIIYQNHSGRAEYISRNQLLDISPKDIENIIQEADLDILHKNKLGSFWSTHADRVKYFIKHKFLQEALEAYQNKILSEKNFKMVSEVAFYSLAIEEADLSDFINPHLYMEALNIAGYSSTDIFLFRDTSQQQVILYISGNKTAFFIFKNYKQCINFLEKNAKNKPKWQQLLTSHFSLDVQDSVLNALKKGPFIGGGFSIATAPFPKPIDPNSIQHSLTTKPIEKSLFETIQKNIQERSYLDANVIITSDRELMLKRILNAVKSIELLLLLPSFGFPLLNWGILAALTTEVAANLYIAKNADTVKERHQAAIDAGINSVEFIFSMAFLSARSLKVSKSQNEIILQDQEKLRLLNSGSGVFSFSEKNPISEELFFDTTKSMKVWQMANSDGLLKHLDAKAWFLDEQFLLFTGKTKKAKHLIISSHGGYLPKSGIVQVPKNTDLVVLGPHGWQLVDPKTAKIAKGLVLPYGIINESAAIPTQTALYPSLFSRSANTHIHPRKTDIKLLAGTSVPGHIRNYTLSKYQRFGVGEESYLDIVRTIHHSRHPFPDIYKMGFQPVDILTIRNRRGKTLPTLADILKSLKSNGIHYDRITLEFCRSKISSSAATPALKYIPARV